MSILTHIKENKRDAIKWQINRWINAAHDDIHEHAKAVDKIVLLLGKITNPFIQQSYSDYVSSTKSFRISKKMLNDVLSRSTVTEDVDEDMPTALDKLPSWMNKEEIEMNGYCEVKTQERVGFYTVNGTSKVEVSNFIIHPIFHVRGEAEDSRHIFEVENRVKRVLLDVPSKVFISLETLQTHLVAKGNFIFFGSKSNLLRIANTLLPKFPLCDEIKQLGWQPEGFFCYTNMVFDTKLKHLKINPYGVVELNEKFFLIPAASKLYAEQRTGDDIFKQLKPLTYLESKVSFKDWSKQMHIVYADKGLVGTAFALATCFRDLLFKINENFPHLYGYGERSSGKSQWAGSIAAIFYKNRAAFNLNSGTDFAFFTYMQSFRNCPAHLNEFDDKVVREEWFQAIKGIFDGEGRMRGKMGNRTHIEVQHVESALMLTGQYVSTKDDNSVVSRSIVESFAEKQFTDAEKAEFDKLRRWQEEGLTSLITEVVQHREEVEQNYYEVYNIILNNWRRETNIEFNQRIFQNYAHLSAMWQIFEIKLGLPVSWIQFNKMAYKKALDNSKFIRSTDTLTDFWTTVVFLLEQNSIVDGWDFKIELAVKLKLRSGDGTESDLEWNEPKKLLYLRLTNVVKLYQQVKAKSGSKDSMSQENLKHYFSNRPYYIGQVKQTQFSRLVFKAEEQVQAGSGLSGPTSHISTKGKKETQLTSAYVFDYDLLGCELERLTPGLEEYIEEPFK